MGSPPLLFLRHFCWPQAAVLRLTDGADIAKIPATQILVRKR
jgi:hypothetical protein